MRLFKRKSVTGRACTKRCISTANPVRLELAIFKSLNHEARSLTIRLPALLVHPTKFGKSYSICEVFFPGIRRIRRKYIEVLKRRSRVEKKIRDSSK